MIPDLSIIILNFNTGNYLKKCLQSIYQSQLKHQLEIIVVDNASTDNSISLAKNFTKNSKILDTKYLILNTNLGFAQGNNRGVKLLNPKTRYVLFLNPDTTVNPDTLSGTIDYLDSHPKIDAATVNVIFVKTGQTQPECHRGFPSPANSFFHFFLPILPRLFPRSRLFNSYFLGHLDFNHPQIIDACVGAFIILKKRVGEIVNWWCPDYFFYGEDLDLCFQLQKHQFKLWYLPQYQIHHFQGISSGVKNTSSKASRATKIKIAKASTDAMRIFYQRNLFKNYSQLSQKIILLGIKLLEWQRLLKAKYL
jgi:GT2 family glycosyltransferase